MKKLFLATSAMLVCITAANAQGVEVGPDGITIGRDHEHYGRDREHRSEWHDRDHERHHHHHHHDNEDYE